MNARENQPTIREFYRILDFDEPTPGDFTSNAAKGKALRNRTEARQRLSEGISLHSTVERARWRARQFNDPPVTRIALLRIAVLGPIVIQKTLNDPGHYTAWGTPEELLACVESVLQVDPA